MKAVVDAILGLVGFLFGSLAQNASSLGPYSGAAPVVGLVGGYFVTDMLSFVNTGQAPAPALVLGQAQTAWAQAKPLLTADFANMKPNPQEQAAFNLAMQMIDSYFAQQPALAQ